MLTASPVACDSPAFGSNICASNKNLNFATVFTLKYHYQVGFTLAIELSNMMIRAVSDLYCEERPTDESVSCTMVSLLSNPSNCLLLSPLPDDLLVLTPGSSLFGSSSVPSSY